LCWQTLASKANGADRLKKYSAAWGTAVVDECHKLGGLIYAKTINRLQARHRLGLTGTVERVDGREFLLHDIIGPVVTIGRVATIPCRVEIKHTGIPIKFSAMEPFPNLHKRIYNAPGRMDIILEDLEKDLAAGRYICFAFHRCSVKQLVHWKDKLRDLGIEAEAFYGSCRDREGALMRARSGETRVLVCNSQMLTGIDVPRWDTFYAAFPTSNVVFNDEGGLSGNFLQEFSRIRTPFTYENGREKKEGIIRDYVDNNSMCFASYKKRYKAYMNQGFEVNVTKVAAPKAKHLL
jgi:superfamily II DNA or RNA helicase